MSKKTSKKRRIAQAIDVAIRYGSTDGAHHKQWVIDQIVRILAADEYDSIIANAKSGVDGPDTYDWDEGIAAMIVGIVGSEEAKFTLRGAARAMQTIHNVIYKYKATGISSGHCHLGGIDIWAEDCALGHGIFDRDLIFPPKILSWSSGFKPRNIQIAKASDVVVCISVDKLPPDFKGSRYTNCYHCIEHGLYTPHVKSGGCWTMWYAKSLGRQTELIVVRN